MVDEFACTYCWETIEAEDYPQECPHCHVGYCDGCETRRKHGPKWCVGCGSLEAGVRASMLRTSSFACFYAEESWQRDGVTNPEKVLYIIGTKFLEPGIKRYWSKFYKDGSTEDIRELTPEEETRIYNDVREQDCRDNQPNPVWSGEGCPGSIGDNSRGGED